MFKYEYWGNSTFSSHANMALEEFFFRRSIQNVATVRFFDFAKDSVILGYAQDTDAIKKHDNSFDVTRRITGGSHIQVGSNIIAYSFTVPRDGSFTNYEDMRAYFAEHVANALGDLGIEDIVIDNKASTINVNGKVVASHAILWGVQSALLHGLIIIDPYDVDELSDRVALQTRKIGNKSYSEYTALKTLPAVSRLLNNVAPNATESVRNTVLKDLISKAILKHVAGKKYENKQVNNKIVSDAFELLRRKYGLPLWVNKHKPTFTKEEVEAIPGEELNGLLKKNLGYCLFIQVKDKDFKKMSQPTE